MKKVALIFLLLGLLLPGISAQDQPNAEKIKQIAQEMKNIKDSYEKLEKQMVEYQELYRKSSGGEPQEWAQRLELAYKQSKEKMVAAQLATAADSVENNQLFSALKEAQSAHQELQLIVQILISKDIQKSKKELEESLRLIESIIPELANQEKAIDPLAKEDEELKKMEQQQQDLNNLIKEQEDLLKKTQEQQASKDMNAAQNAKDLQKEIADYNKMIDDLQKRMDKQQDAIEKTEMDNDKNRRNEAMKELDDIRNTKQELDKMEKEQNRLNEEMAKAEKQIQNSPELANLTNLIALRDKLKQIQEEQKKVEKETDEAVNGDRPPDARDMEQLANAIDKAKKQLDLLKDRQEDATKTTKDASEAKIDPEAVGKAKEKKAKVEDVLDEMIKLRDQQQNVSSDLEKAVDKGQLLDPVKDKQNALGAEAEKMLAKMEPFKDQPGVPEAMADMKKAQENMKDAGLRIGENKDQDAISKQAEAIENMDNALEKMNNLSNKLEQDSNPGSLEMAADKQRAANKLAEDANKIMQQVPPEKMPKDVDVPGAMRELEDAIKEMAKAQDALDNPDPEIDPNNPQTFKDLADSRAKNGKAAAEAQAKASEKLDKARAKLDKVMEAVAEKMMSPADKQAAENQKQIASEAEKLSKEIDDFVKNTPPNPADPEAGKEASQNMGKAKDNMANASKNLAKGQSEQGQTEQSEAAQALADAQNALARMQMQMTAKAADGQALAKAAEDQKKLQEQAAAMASKLNSMAQKAEQAGNANEQKAMSQAANSTANAAQQMNNAQTNAQLGQLGKAGQQGKEAKEKIAEAKKAIDEKEQKLAKKFEKNTPEERQKEQKENKEQTDKTAQQMQESGKNQQQQGAQKQNSGQQQRGGQMGKAGDKAKQAGEDMDKAEKTIPKDPKEAMKNQTDAMKKLEEAKAELEALKQKAQEELNKNPMQQLADKQKEMKEKTAKLADNMNQQNKDQKGGDQKGGDQKGGNQKQPKGDQLKKAADDMKKSEENLKKQEADEAAKKMKEAIEKMKKEAEELARLAKAKKEAEQAKKEKFGKIEEANKKAAENIKKVASKMKGDMDSKSAQQADAAKKNVEKANEELRKKTRDALEEERKALEKLRKLAKDIRAKLREVEEREKAAQLDSMIEIVSKMLEEQININVITKTVDNERAKQEGNVLNRGQELRVTKIGKSEDGLSEIAKDLYIKLVQEETVVFSAEVDLIQKNMEDVGISLNKDKDTGPFVQDIEDDIVNSLQLLKNCLIEARKTRPVPMKDKKKKGGKSGKGKKKKDGKQPPLVVPLAELVLIKFKQLGVNSKTSIFHKKRIADFAKTNPKETMPSNDKTPLVKILKKELARISKDQMRLAQYTQDLDGKIVSQIPVSKGFGRPPELEKLPLHDIAVEMFGVKKRLDQELTERVTKLKQGKIVKMLDDMIKEAQKVPEKKNKSNSKDKNKSSESGKEKKKMDPSKGQKKDSKGGKSKDGKSKSGKKSSKQKGKSKSKKGVKDSKAAEHSEGTGEGKPGAIPTGGGEERWGGEDEAEGIYVGRVESEDEFPPEYREEVSAYFRFLNEWKRKQKEEEGGGTVPAPSDDDSWGREDSGE